MNRDQSARLKRHQKVARTLHDNPADVAALPAFQDLATDYLHRQEQLTSVLAQTTGRSEGATEAKNGHETALLAPLVRHANALMLLYKKQGNLAAARSLHVHRSDYSRLGAPGLATEADAVAKAAVLRQADLAPYGIKPAHVQELSQLLAAFVAASPAPKTSIEQRKIGGASFRRALKELDNFLKDDLQAGMQLLAADYPALYARLQEARRIDEPGYGRSGKAQARKAAKKKGKGDNAADGTPRPSAE